MSATELLKGVTLFHEGYVHLHEHPWGLPNVFTSNFNSPEYCDIFGEALRDRGAKLGMMDLELKKPLADFKEFWRRCRRYGRFARQLASYGVPVGVVSVGPWYRSTRLSDTIPIADANRAIEEQLLPFVQILGREFYSDQNIEDLPGWAETARTLYGWDVALVPYMHPCTFGTEKRWVSPEEWEDRLRVAQKWTDATVLWTENCEGDGGWKLDTTAIEAAGEKWELPHCREPYDTIAARVHGLRWLKSLNGAHLRRPPAATSGGKGSDSAVG